MNRKLFLIIALFFSLMAVGACSYATLPWLSTPSKNGSIIDVTYCGPVPSGLCVISFGLDNQGRMLVNFITPKPSFPDFYLNIKQLEKDNRYECQKVDGFPTSVYCIGDPISLGEKVDLEVYSISQGDLIAKGGLVISFYALQSPFTVFVTSTGETGTSEAGVKTSTPPASTTPPATVTGRTATPTSTPSTPSYP